MGSKFFDNYKLLNIIKFSTISTKIMGIIIGIVLLLGGWVSFQTYDTMQTTLREQLMKQGISTGQYISARSVDLIFTNDTFSLHQLISKIVESNKDVRYVFILDSQGEIITNSFGKLLPKGLLNANDVFADTQQNIQTLNTEEGLIYDIAIPIFEGTAGTVRLGMSELEIKKDLDKTMQRMLVTTILVAVLGIFIAYFFTSLLTKPIVQMVETTKAIGKGQFDKKVKLAWGHDEIMLLGKAFNEMIENLQKFDQTRSNLLKKIITAQEEERKRIARELHDQTGQSLTSLMIGLRMLEESKDIEEIKEKGTQLRQLTNDTLDEIRDLSLALRPSVLDDLGLEAALKRYTQECSVKLGVDVDFQAFGIQGLYLEPEVRLTIYRVVQEALTNVAKYSKATEASVILERKGNKLIAIIEDNGVGFDVQSILDSTIYDKKLGLHGMMERVNLIGGELTIESEPGMGTTIYIHISLKGLVDDEENKNLNS
ncbi:MAG: histidine kinase [Bacillota bacterium]